jgi:hypothetical protein
MIKGFLLVAAAWTMAMVIVQFGINWAAVASPSRNVVVSFSDGNKHEGTLHRNWDGTKRWLETAQGDVVSVSPRVDNVRATISFNGANDGSATSAWRFWVCLVLAASMAIFTPLIAFNTEKR